MHAYVSVWCVCVMQCTCGVLCVGVFGESCECVCCVVSEFTLHKAKPTGLTPFIKSFTDWKIRDILLITK